MKLSRVAIALLAISGCVEPVQAQVLRATRTLSLDGTRHDFTQVRFVDAFPDGSIVVAQPQDHRLLIFEPSGVLRREVGRAGAGPGEFRSIGWAHGFVGDTLWVFDVALNRFTFLLAGGRIVSNWVRPALRRGRTTIASSTGSVPLAFAPDGSVILHADLVPGLPSPEAKWIRPGWSDAIVSMNRRGDLHAVIGGWPSSAEMCGTEPATRSDCPAAWVMASRSGRRIVQVVPHILSVNQAAVEVIVLGAVGDTLWSRRHPFRVVPIPEAERDSVRRRLVSLSRSSAGAAYWRNATLREYRKPIVSAFIGSDDTIWIEGQPTSDGRPWLILQSDGRVLGTLTVPRRIWISSGDRNGFLGTEEDPDGVESVVRYRLHQ